MVPPPLKEAPSGYEEPGLRIFRPVTRRLRADEVASWLAQRRDPLDPGRFRAVAFRLAYPMLACVLTRLMLLARADAVNDVEILVLARGRRTALTQSAPEAE